MEQGTGNKDPNRPGFMSLKAWQKSDDLASAVFRSVSKLPIQYQWLGNQMSRAAVSVPANIAEGYGRGSLGDYLRFLDIAKGSLSELENYIHFLSKESLLSLDQVQVLEVMRADTGRLLNGLWLALKHRASSTWDHEGRMIRELSEDYEVPD
jgi:four helix bundle protein